MPRADQVHRTPSARSPLNSSSLSSPALHQQSFSMSSFSPPLAAPVVTKTPKRTRAPHGMGSSDLKVVTGGGVSSHTPAKPEGVILPGEQSNGYSTVALDNGSPLSNYTPLRAEPDSEYNLSSQALHMGRDNSGFTRNEENSHDPKESIEKNNTLEQRRNATFDERNESSPGAPGYDTYQAPHPQTKPVSQRGCTPYAAPSANIVQPSVSRREQPHNPIHGNGNDSGSPHAHNADQSRDEFLPDVPVTESPSAGPTVSSGHPQPSASLSPPNANHEGFSSSNLATPVLTARQGSKHTSNFQPVPSQSSYHPPPPSHSQPNVSIQPSPRPAPGTTTRHNPQNEELGHRRRRRGWTFFIRCDCMSASS
jgi:hypothetical protein